MVEKARLRLSLLFTFFCISYFPTFSMNSYIDETKQKMEYNGLYDLSQDFMNVIKSPDEFINLQINKDNDYRYDASGVYKLIPHYQRIFPKDNDNTSRFIIEKHPINDEWLLTELYHSIYRRTIFNFPQIKNENPLRDDIIVRAFDTLQNEAKQMHNANLTLKEEINSKNTEITSLREEAKSFKLMTDTNVIELKQKHEEEIEKITENFEKKIKSVFAKTQKPYEQLKTEIKETFKENQRLSNEENIQKKKEIQKKFEKQIEEKEQEFQQSLFEKERKINNLEVQLTQFQKTNDNLHLEIKKLQSETTKILYIKETLENDLKTLRVVNDNIINDSREMKSKLKVTEDEKKKLKKIEEKKKLNKLESKCEIISHQNLEKQINFFTNKIFAIETYKNNILKQFKETNKNLENAETKLLEKEFHIQNLEDQFKNLKFENNNLIWKNEMKNFETESIENLENTKQIVFNNGYQMTNHLEVEFQKLNDNVQFENSNAILNNEMNNFETGKEFKSSVRDEASDAVDEMFITDIKQKNNNKDPPVLKLDLQEKETTSEYNLEKEFEIICEHMLSEYDKHYTSFWKLVSACDDKELVSKMKNFLATVMSERQMNTKMYQYEFILVHHGNMVYAKKQKMKIDENFKFLDTINVNCKNKETSIKNWWKEKGKKNYLQLLKKLYIKHKKLRDDDLQYLEDKETKEKCYEFITNYEFFQKNENKYENLLKSIGYVNGEKKTVEQFKDFMKNMLINPNSFGLKHKVHFENMSKQSLIQQYQGQTIIAYMENKNKDLIQSFRVKMLEVEDCIDPGFKNSVEEFIMDKFDCDAKMTYENIFTNYGAMVYLKEKFDHIEEDFEFLDTTSIQTRWKETEKQVYVKILKTQYKKFYAIVTELHKTLEDKNVKQWMKFGLFTKNNKLFEENQYVYENIFKEMGYLKYGAQELLNEYKKSLEERYMFNFKCLYIISDLL